MSSCSAEEADFTMMLFRRPEAVSSLLHLALRLAEEAGLPGRKSMMSMIRQLTRVVVVFAVSSMAGGAAAPVPVLDVRMLTADAHVIAVGAVEHVERQEFDALATPDGRTTTVQWMRARVRVDQILKGDPTISTLEVRFAVDAPMGGSLGGLAEGAYEVVFLKRGKDGYEFVSPYHPSVPTWPGGRGEGTDPEERVLRALTSVLLSSAPPHSLKRRTIHLLWGIDHPVVVAGLDAALQDADLTLSLTAAASLLAANQVRVLPVAEGVLLRDSVNMDPVLLHNLRVGISDGVRDPEAIPGLVRLSKATDAETRRVATAALAGTESMAAVPALARMLDDDDFEVRIEAVRGLAVLSGQRNLTPSWDSFRQEESRYTEPLRAWALMHSAAQ
jgi:hypothetical protein